MRAGHPCGTPGCPQIVRGKPRCPAHTIERKKDPAQAKYYGSSAWQQLRAVIRRQQPICQVCRRAPSQSVDHIDGDWKNNATENLRGACNPCHATKSGSEHFKKR